MTDDIKIERAHNFSYPVKINNKQPTRYFFPYLSIETSFSAVRHNCFFLKKERKKKKGATKSEITKLLLTIHPIDFSFFFFFIFNPPKFSEHFSLRIGNLSNFRIPFVSKLNFINR